MESLPQFIALKAMDDHDGLTRKYLGCVIDEGSFKGHLQYSFPILDPAAKFEVEPAKTGDRSGLVHIRSCYNNKYWVRKSEKEFWIVAAAAEKKEVKSAWDCTLFKPHISLSGVDKDTFTVQFDHVQLGQTVGISARSSDHNLCLCVNSPLVANMVKTATSTVFDYDKLVILPKRVAFKGDNGHYLKAFEGPHCEYLLQFWGKDLGSDLVPQEVFTTDDGYYRFKTTYWGKFWKLRDPRWIWADSTDTSSNNKHTLFWAEKVNDNTITLRCMGNNLYCKRFTDEVQDCLSAWTTKGKEDQTCHLIVEEPVKSRTIEVIEFDLDRARIYGHTPIVVDTLVAHNTSYVNTESTNLVFSYTETFTSTWNKSQSLKGGGKTTLKSGIPFIVKGQIEVSLGGVIWHSTTGETTTTTKQAQDSYTVKVLPRTSVSVTLVATQAKCDVPFKYMQIDELENGEKISVTLSDGIYTGVNTFNYDFTNKEEPLKQE